MKYIFTVFLAVLCGIQVVHAQDIKPVDSVVLYKENIVGRWIEKTRFNNINDSVSAQPYTYIFKEDNLFHRGTATNDVLIFNVAGRFQVENDTISIFYQDYLHCRSGDNKAQTMLFRIVSWSDTQMTAIVTAPHTAEYMVILTRQIFQ